jgi:ribonuclease D
VTDTGELPSVADVPEADLADPAVPTDAPDPADAAPDEPEIPWLLEPAGGIPDVIISDREITELIARLAGETGPIAVDAERASGYRYSQRAYLVQLRRGDGPTALIDPIACPDLSRLGAALADVEWVLHAASQDLVCLDEVGLTPRTLFDTELAARLLGYPRVALGTMIEQLLGVRLEKGHSAADWSTRPLPESWLAYAALDVELLLPLRDALERELTETGKLSWALEEFVAARTNGLIPPVPRSEPWRRLSGIHKIRKPRQLAAARALWEARDALAQKRDVAPGRVLPDAAIIAAAAGAPTSESALKEMPVFTGPRQRRQSSLWWSALRDAARLPDEDLPRITQLAQPGAPAQASRWAERDPVAAERLSRVRAALGVIAEENNLPVENLLEPALVRRIAWEPPPDVAEAMESGGARSWQIALTADDVAKALLG